MKGISFKEDSYRFKINITDDEIQVGIGDRGFETYRMVETSQVKNVVYQPKNNTFYIPSIEYLWVKIFFKDKKFINNIFKVYNRTKKEKANERNNN